MENILIVAMLTRRLLLEEPGVAMMQSSITDHDQIESYISSSIKSSFARILQAVDKSDINHEHPLAALAEETKKLLKKDSTLFMPILSKRHPHAIVVSVSLLHRLYGNKLKPFLDGVEHLTEDVVSVFPAADSLEQSIMALILSECEEGTAELLYRKLTPYQHWDPISPQQQYGSSVVEVYRIVEETVDQFFALKVPMRSPELTCLLRGIDNAFQVYASRIIEKLASKEDLVPPVPILTRYKKEVGIKA